MLYINKRIAMQYLMGNESIYNKIKNSFLISNSNYINRYIEIIDSNNIDEAYSYIHSIKGISLNLGAEKLFDSCNVVLEELKKGLWKKDLIEDFFKVLKGTYEELNFL